MEDFFALLGLQLDENDKTVIENAVWQYERKLQEKGSNSVNPMERRDAINQLHACQKMKEMMLDSELRKAHARQCQQMRIKRAEEVVRVTVDAGVMSVDEAAVQELADKLGLRVFEVEKLFLSKGCSLNTEPPFSIEDHVLSKSLERNIEEAMAYVRIAAEDPSNVTYYPFISGYDDLYCLLNGYNGGGLTQTEQLFKAAEKGAKQFATASGSLSALSKAFNISKQVFATEEDRMKYNTYLALRKLGPLFEMVRMIPVSVRRTASYADQIIEKIMDCIPNRQLAIALYNREAGLNSMPYIPAPISRPVIAAPQVDVNFDGRELHIVVTNVPENLAAVYYAAGDEFFCRQDAMRGKMLRVKAEEYHQDGGISMRVPADKKLSVTVVLELNIPGSATEFSEVAQVLLDTKRPQIVSYRIAWNNKVGRCYNAKLYVTTDGDKLPALRLVYRLDAGVPLGDDCETVCIYTIGPFDQRSAAIDLPERIFRGLPAGSYIRLVSMPGENVYTDAASGLPWLPT